MDHLHEEEGEVQVQLNPKRHDGHLHAEECEYKVQLVTEHMVITCKQKMNIKSNSMQEAMVVQNKNKHFHVNDLRCVHRSHFQSGFLN